MNSPFGSPPGSGRIASPVRTSGKVEPGPNTRPTGQGISGNFRTGGAGGVPSTPNSSQGAISTAEPHRYAKVTSSFANIGATAVLILQQPPGLRNFLALTCISVVGGADMIFGFAAAPIAGRAWLRLAAGQTVIFDAVVPQDDIYAWWSAADTGVCGFAFSNMTV